MHVVDLSHVLKSGMPVYPGTNAPEISVLSTFEKDGFAERHISMVSHTGTHIDAPAHILANGKTLSDYTPEAFLGKALKFNLSNSNPITIDKIQARISALGIPDFILFSNEWDKYWGTPAYFEKFPLPDSYVFKFICKLAIKGIGIDSVSIDPVGSKELINHKIVLSKELIIIENLTNLNNLPETLFDIYCLPLNIQDGDGSPVRAIACYN